MPVISDYLLRSTAVLPGLFVRATNNATAVAYISDAVADANGKYTFGAQPPIPGTYTLATSPTGAAPWTPTGDTNYIVPVSAGDDLVVKSLTVLPGSPYTPSSPAGTIMSIYYLPPPSGGDDTTVVQNIIAAAQAANGGIVAAQPGTYLFNKAGGTALSIAAGKPIWLMGAGRGATTFKTGATAAPWDLIHCNADYSLISDIFLDVLTNAGQAALVMQANYTRFLRSRVASGSNAFGVFYTGPAGATQASPLYNTGNIIDDLIFSETFNGDGFSWSFQDRGRIRDVQHTGSRLAVYVCKACDVEGVDFTPGLGGGFANGIWITESKGVHVIDYTYRINAFVTAGFGICRIAADAIYTCDDITFDRLRVEDPSNLQPGAAVGVGDVINAKFIAPHLETNTNIVLQPLQAASQKSILIEGGVVPQISAQQGGAITVRSKLVNVYFPAFTPAAGQNGNALANYNLNPWVCDVLGGEAAAPGSFISATPPSTFSVRNVRGFNPQGNLVTTPAFPATGVAVTNTPALGLGCDVLVNLLNGANALTLQIGTLAAAIVIPANAAYSFILPAGVAFTPTYAGGAPTHKWYGL